MGLFSLECIYRDSCGSQLGNENICCFFLLFLCHIWSILFWNYHRSFLPCCGLWNIYSFDTRTSSWRSHIRAHTYLLSTKSQTFWYFVFQIWCTNAYSDSCWFQFTCSRLSKNRHNGWWKLWALLQHQHTCPFETGKVRSYNVQLTLLDAIWSPLRSHFRRRREDQVCT